MRHGWWLICLLLAGKVQGIDRLPKDTLRSFEIREGDTAHYTLKLALDEKGRPKYFFRNIFTPVCNTGECKPVYINFYWDLLGNYTHYNMPNDEVLTKTDHREFREEDYRKLQEIIFKPNSIFSELKMEDLVVTGTEKISDSVDIRTGATLKTIKNEVIEGAVYTCYTLWHLAHGGTVKEIKQITEGLEDAALLHSFLRSDNHHYQYWAMDRVMDAAGNIRSGYTDDILHVISGENLFTARYALNKVNPALLASSKNQQWLWKLYEGSSYPLQMVILKKLTEVKLTDGLSLKLAANATTGNREQLKAKLKALTAQQPMSPKVQLELAKQMEHPDYGEDVYAALQQVPQKDPRLEKILTQHTSKNN